MEERNDTEAGIIDRVIPDSYIASLRTNNMCNFTYPEVADMLRDIKQELKIGIENMRFLGPVSKEMLIGTSKEAHLP